jgi:hypothetical protein
MEGPATGRGTERHAHHGSLAEDRFEQPRLLGSASSEQPTSVRDRDHQILRGLGRQIRDAAEELSGGSAFRQPLSHLADRLEGGSQ